jgi:hypothetical protein
VTAVDVGDLRVGDVLHCSAGHPVWMVSLADALAAVLDPEWELPDVEACCVFCGPAGQARAGVSAG